MLGDALSNKAHGPERATKLMTLFIFILVWYLTVSDKIGLPNLSARDYPYRSRSETKDRALYCVLHGS
jgi:hypothetical protein